MGNPNCYACKHRRDLPGDAHSCCSHPRVDAQGDIVTSLVHILSGQPPIGMKELGIKANKHGFMSGWFNWPYNYDPVWLESCLGFEEKKDG